MSKVTDRHSLPYTKQSFESADDYTIKFLAVAILLSMVLAYSGFLGSIGTLSGANYAYCLLGMSAAITVCSFFKFSPFTVPSAALALLGLAGGLPYTTVGLGVMIAMSIPLIATAFSSCILEIG